MNAAHRIGQLIGGYRLQRLLGQGGMGTVYQAQHEQIGRKAAIKVLHPHLCNNPQLLERFFNEARAANLVDHPGVVEIYEHGRLPDEAAYLIMELLPGEPLSRLAPPPPCPAVLRIARQVASALSAVHARGIIHRDLKPDNIMLIPDPEVIGQERVKLLDFGIAKLAGDLAGDLRTESGALMGTPRYMSPEQCRGTAGLTDRSDVYSLGIILYELLAGVPPFPAQTTGEMIIQRATEAPRPLREVAPHLPAALHALVMQMLAREAALRPPMQDVTLRLQVLQAAATQPDLPGLGAAPAPAAAPRRRLAVPGLLGGLVGLLIALGLLLLTSRPAPMVAPAAALLPVAPAAPPRPPAAAPRPPAAPVQERAPLAGQPPVTSAREDDVPGQPARVSSIHRTRGKNLSLVRPPPAPTAPAAPVRNEDVPIF